MVSKLCPAAAAAGDIVTDSSDIEEVRKYGLVLHD